MEDEIKVVDAEYVTIASAVAKLEKKQKRLERMWDDGILSGDQLNELVEVRWQRWRCGVVDCGVPCVCFRSSWWWYQYIQPRIVLTPSPFAPFLCSCLHAN
jgi:hypothetical protein